MKAGGVLGRAANGISKGDGATESTFARIKSELVHRESYANAEEARASVFEYVEVFWNRERRHSTLGGVCPQEYEQSHNPGTR